ncbi:glycosyltransferase family 4 protein [Pontibacter lucknowensis]|uniref:Glycosyltransferase involved in cell wall bisynthesis n=1 Tax=Pontibacter lucknowensis TaxID=1077936 RepID=A0A1N6Y7J2_9BACT|nr:glycosyltransferase family 4 protein [Pontibacter lucknowensis]SIR10548.1 Glycosyltransferase involved in cell wall bisynthesis [Pontibacter lucknowensis]
MQDITIAYTVPSYNEKRSIINKIEEANYTYAPVSRYLARYSNKYNKLEKLNALFYPRVDIFHYFNHVSFGDKPWVTTFETLVPRYNQCLNGHHGEAPTYRHLQNDIDVLRALGALAGEACKKVIALSECNYKIQEFFLSHFDSKFSERILPKMVILPPPQKLYVTNWAEKGVSLDEPITFTFVGRDIARKGGLNILEAFTKLKAKYAIHLNIISSLSPSKYAATDSAETLNSARSIIESNSSWITHYENLPNEKVLEIMKKTHVGLLPTWADTYGYSVLEFQAHGCPVVTTDIRALPEINNNEKGWLIQVPKNKLGEAIYTSVEYSERLNAAINEGLTRVLDEIFTSLETIKIKSEKCIEDLKTNHCEEKFAHSLRGIYQDALK